MNIIYKSVIDVFNGMEYEGALRNIDLAIQKLDNSALKFAMSAPDFKLLYTRYNEVEEMTTLHYLIYRNIEADYRKFFHNMAQLKSEDSINLMIEKSKYPTKYCTDFLKFVISKGYNINKANKGWTPLVTAVSLTGGDEWVNYILGLPGIDVNVRCENSVTALACAASNGSVVERGRHKNYYELFVKLLEMGADPNIQDKNNKNTVLHDLVLYESDERFYEIALKYGANPNAQNKYGETPLHYALSHADNRGFSKQMREYYERVIDILKPKTDLSILNKDKKSCSDLLNELK